MLVSDADPVWELSEESAPRANISMSTGLSGGTRVGTWKKTQHSAPTCLFWFQGGEWGDGVLYRDRSVCTQICNDTGMDVVVIDDANRQWEEQLKKIVSAIEEISVRYQAYFIAGVSSGAHRATLALARLAKHSFKMPGHVWLIAPVVRIAHDSLWRLQSDPSDRRNLTVSRMTSLVDLGFQNPDVPNVNPSQISVDLLERFPPATLVMFSNDILNKDIIDVLGQQWSNWKGIRVWNYEGPHHLLRLDMTNQVAWILRQDLVQDIRRRSAALWSDGRTLTSDEKNRPGEYLWGGSIK